MTRDFVGYGAEPPHPRWPGEARVAVNFVINFEEGSELSYPAGDGVSETGLIESASTDAGNRRDLAAESMFEYGARVGWWRLHRIFTRFGLPVTLFACARALQANPPAAAAIAATDWDICGHGYRWIKHYELGEAEERDQIARAVALIRETTGKPTLGWYCRYAPSENTRRLFVEEGAQRPRMMSIGLHMRLTGHPGRAKALIRFIEHILGHERVWICRREDIAR